MNKTKNKSTGKIGEDIASEFLKKKGYQIIERNWGNKWGEIDIIAKDKDIIVFVEVKTKIGINFGTPEEMVGNRILSHIQKVSSIYTQNSSSPKRIDVIAVVLSSDMTPIRINHYEAVY